MNIKQNNEETPPTETPEPAPLTPAEERRRTGRVVAIVVGISLVCLAVYHAWIRRVPVLASLLVPALIMLLYIAWVLYTASKDRRKEADRDADVEAPPTTNPQPTTNPPAVRFGFRRCNTIA